MKLVVDLVMLLLVPLGAVLIYFGDMDDSPGLGGVGFLLIFLSMALVIRRELQSRRAKNGPQSDTRARAAR